MLTDILASLLFPLKTLHSETIHPKLGEFFKSCCLRYTYVSDGSFREHDLAWFLYVISFPALFLGTLRFAFLIFHVGHPFYSTLLADFSFFMGQASFWFLLACLVWFVAALISRVYSEISNYKVSYQEWMKSMIHLQHPEYSRDLSTQRGSKLTLLILRFNLIAGTICAAAVHLPIIIGFPIQWLPVTLAHTFFTAFHGYLVGCYEVNFTILTGHYLYVYGRKHHRMASKAKLVAASTQSDYNEYFIRFLTKFKTRMISLSRDMVKINRFMAPVSSIIFTGTFLNETLCLYLTFFVDIEGPPKYVIRFLGFLTILYGQVIYFIAGSYAQHRYDECVTQLHHLIEFKAMKIPLSLRIKSLIASEYLTERKVFTLLETIDVSTINFIKVQVEMTMLLLMLIGNVKRSYN
uniref:Gustatory receptor n=1 Tax=Tetranychus urticae TaxID=32264 RepID=T1KSJ7_TETUR